MIYLTLKQTRKPRQLSWEDVFYDKVVLNDLTSSNNGFATSTVTRKFETIHPELLGKINIQGMIEWLKKFVENNKELYECPRQELYHTFKIPKKTGGYREINAPCDSLQTALRQLSNFLTEDCGMLYHTSAFAYVKGRSTVDCVKKHQANKSQWFLKTDFSGFFPNTTLDFVMKMMKIIFPMSEVCRTEEGYHALYKALSLGFLRGGLPQGTCLSPTLTNIFMIPIDYTLFNALADRHIVYTRYADDIHVSAVEKFPYKDIVKLIKETLESFGAPYEIKKEKTHYGSRSGKNWNLGLMLNKDNEITVGATKKRFFKAALCSFVLDTINKKYWTLEDVQTLQGQLAYYRMVERKYFDNIINQQNKKWHVDIMKLIHMYLEGTLAA